MPPIIIRGAEAIMFAKSAAAKHDLNGCNKLVGSAVKRKCFSYCSSVIKSVSLATNKNKVPNPHKQNESPLTFWTNRIAWSFLTSFALIVLFSA